MVKLIISFLIASMLAFTMPFTSEAASTTGGILISLRVEGESSTGNREQITGTPVLMPTQVVPYYITITNRKSSSWVRLKVTYVTSATSAETTIDDSWLRGIDTTKWVKRGEYWYRTVPFTTGESDDFCNAIQIPDITSLSDDVSFKIISKAEAIQEAHIHPDFSSDNPFAGIMIESQDRTGDEGFITDFRIIHENGSETIVDTSDITTDITGMMPGDTITGVVKIQNSNNYKVKIKFRESGESTNDILTKKMQLEIIKDGRKVYSGPFTDNSLVNGITLGEYRNGTSGEITFKLHLPLDSDNNTAFRNLKLAWIFRAEKAVTGGSGGSNSGSGGNAESATIYSYPDGTVTKGYSGGAWKQLSITDKKWEYTFSNGTRAKDGWLYLYNPYSKKNSWFYFNKLGFMEYGWIKMENDNWYFCHDISDGSLGELQRGWHYDKDDKRTYYLDPVTYIMQSGWRPINGKYYYFTTKDDITRQNWFWSWYSDMGHWIYDKLGFRTYGSMFIDEKTPDGYTVDENGVWDGKEKQ